MRIRNVEKHFYVNYLKKAEEFLGQSNEAINNKKWNVAVSLAIHSGICAADALTVFHSSIRSVAESHEEVAKLISTINLKDVKIKTRQLLNLLNVKNSAEYSEDLMNEKDALSAKQNAERFLSWVKDNLKQA